jgi:hypothetical protein
VQASARSSVGDLLFLSFGLRRKKLSAITWCEGWVVELNFLSYLLFYFLHLNLNFILFYLVRYLYTNAAAEYCTIHSSLGIGTVSEKYNANVSDRMIAIESSWSFFIRLLHINCPLLWEILKKTSADADRQMLPSIYRYHYLWPVNEWTS